MQSPVVRASLLAAPLLVMAGGVACAQCTGDASQVAAADAGADAGSVDARIDAQRTDTNGVFEPPDAGAGWRWYSAVGPSCTGYAVPEVPEAVMPPLLWTSCAFSPYVQPSSKCEEWDRSRWRLSTGYYLTSLEVSGDGETFRLPIIHQSDKELYEASLYVYSRSSLKPLAGFRFQRYGGAAGGQHDACLLDPIVRGMGAPFVFTYNPGFATISGSLAEIMASPTRRSFSPDYTPHPDLASDISASDSTLAVNTYGGVVRVRRSDMTWVRATNSLSLSVPLVVDDDVIVRDQTLGWYRMSRVEPNGDTVVVRQQMDRNIVGAVQSGAYLYWMEEFGAASATTSQPKLEVWRTLYTRDVAAFNAGAERLGSLDGDFGFGASLVYDGVFATGNSTQAVVLRLSDRKVKTFNTGTNIQANPFHVDQTSLWVRIVGPNLGDAHYGRVAIDW